MSRKKDLLCLDKCDVQPKLITDVQQMYLHPHHDVQIIENICELIEEKDNQRIVNDFFSECNIESMLSQNEQLKNIILKNFTINLTGFFDDIQSSLCYNLQENQRIEGILHSIFPEYKQDILSQIEGDFQFLQKKNIKALQDRTMNQKQRNIKAKNELQDLTQKIQMLFPQQNVQVIEQPIVPLERAKPQLIQDTHFREISKDFETPQSIQRLIEWDQDDSQEDRMSKKNSFKNQFGIDFLSNRSLLIQLKNQVRTNEDEITTMVNFCLRFKPYSLTIELGTYKIIDISPLRAFKALDNLTSLTINLYKNQIIDLTPLVAITTLINLTCLSISLYSNGITDISPLGEIKNLVNLTSLTIFLGKNEIKDIWPLRAFKALVSLTMLTINLNYNRITDITPLAEIKSLVNLTSLTIYLTGNGISDISPLSNINHLVKLDRLTIYLLYNRVADISPFSVIKTMSHLKFLNIDLTSTGITDISPLSELINLKHLGSVTINLGGNNLPLRTPIQFQSFFDLVQYFKRKESPL